MITISETKLRRIMTDHLGDDEGPAETIDAIIDQIKDEQDEEAEDE